MAEGRSDIITVVLGEHEAVEELFTRFEAGDASVVPTVVRELRIHSQIEQAVLYPVMREELDRGEELTEHALGEHVEVERTVAEIEGMEAGIELDDAMTGLISDVRDHVTEEEDTLLPSLREALDEDRLVALGEQWVEARRRIEADPSLLEEAS